MQDILYATFFFICSMTKDAPLKNNYMVIRLEGSVVTPPYYQVETSARGCEEYFVGHFGKVNLLLQISTQVSEKAVM